jgi:hypothetical protein
MRRLLHNLRLIDGTGAPAREAALLIEGETLVHAGPLAAGTRPPRPRPRSSISAGAP